MSNLLFRDDVINLFHRAFLFGEKIVYIDNYKLGYDKRLNEIVLLNDLSLGDNNIIDYKVPGYIDTIGENCFKNISFNTLDLNNVKHIEKFGLNSLKAKNIIATNCIQLDSQALYSSVVDEMDLGINHLQLDFYSFFFFSCKSNFKLCLKANYDNNTGLFTELYSCHIFGYTDLDPTKIELVDFGNKSENEFFLLNTHKTYSFDVFMKNLNSDRKIMY